MSKMRCKGINTTDSVRCGRTTFVNKYGYCRDHRSSHPEDYTIVTNDSEYEVDSTESDDEFIDDGDELSEYDEPEETTTKSTAETECNKTTHVDSDEENEVEVIEELLIETRKRKRDNILNCSKKKKLSYDEMVEKNNELVEENISLKKIIFDMRTFLNKKIDDHKNIFNLD